MNAVTQLTSPCLPILNEIVRIFYGFSFLLAYKMAFEYWPSLAHAGPWTDVVFMMWILGSLLAAWRPRVVLFRFAAFLGVASFLILRPVVEGNPPWWSLDFYGFLAMTAVGLAELVRPGAFRLASMVPAVATMAVALAALMWFGASAHVLVLPAIAFCLGESEI